MIGSTTTYRVFALLLAVAGVAVACTENEGCDACLAEANCVWVPVEGCLESCTMIADTSCYEPANFPDTNVSDICTLAADAQADSELCSTQEECGDCVGTILSDGNSTCQWFSEGEFCASGCGMDGCGETTCAPEMGDCEENEACSDCLGEGCAWTTVQGCITSCDMIADTACFEVSRGGDSVLDICAVADDVAADTELCAEQEDCGSCVGTVLSDGNTTCQWFGNFCQSGCGMDGCGETTCGPAMGDCEENEACSDCLGEGCAWTTVQGCITSCDMIADTACFEVSGGDDFVLDICAVADDIAADTDLCAGQEDCGSCVGTILSDGNTTCQWFGNFCQSGCGMDGCGETTCTDAEIDTCGDSGGCLDCLQEGCAWTLVDGCIASCVILADAACFEAGTNSNVTDICTVADQTEADAQLCSAQMDCTTCVATNLTDGASTCQWFADGEYCASSCGMDGCGDMECPGNDPEPPQADDPAPPPGDASSTPPPTAAAAMNMKSFCFLAALVVACLVLQVYW